MKVMVTGATGFIGRKLCLALAQNGTVVHALCRNEHHPLLIAHPNIVAFKGDITDRKSLLRAMHGCEGVYHTAAMAKMWCSNKNDFYKVNVAGTKNILEAALTTGVIKIVHTSTCGVIGPTHKHPMLKGKKEIVPGTINKMLLLFNSFLPSFIKEHIIKSKLKTIMPT